MREYPSRFKKTIDGIFDAVNQICRIHNEEEIGDYNSINSKFIMGRLTARVPSSSSDVAAGDRIGDFCPDSSGGYLYILLNPSGTPTWFRTVISSSF